MHHLLFIDVDLYSDTLKEQVLRFRSLVPHIPTIWTSTVEFPSDFLQNFAALPHDPIFTKPDTDASLNAYSSEGEHLLDYLKKQNITLASVGGATFYGCLLGGIQDLRSLNIYTQCMIDLTDYNELARSDYLEGHTDWNKNNIHCTTSIQVLHQISQATTKLTM